MLSKAARALEPNGCGYAPVRPQLDTRLPPTYIHCFGAVVPDAPTVPAGVRGVPPMQHQPDDWSPDTYHYVYARLHNEGFICPNNRVSYAPTTGFHIIDLTSC